MITTYIIIGIVIALAVLLCFALAIASFSFENYYDKLKKIQQCRNTYGITTLQYVTEINNRYFDKRLKLTRCREFYDHYSTNIIALSDKTMSSNSLASLAIVSHELGHARQDYEGNKLKKNWRMKKAGRICGLFFMPLMIAGAILSLLQVFNVLKDILFLIIGLSCLGLGVLIFIYAIILKYKEIKIEKEASDYAIEFLSEILTQPELDLCKDLLNSARLTYWASLLKTLLSWTFLAPKDNMFK